MAIHNINHKSCDIISIIHNYVQNTIKLIRSKWKYLIPFEFFYVSLPGLIAITFSYSDNQIPAKYNKSFVVENTSCNYEVSLG